jgi:DNA gyrase inhibitor GyrI
MKIDFKELPPRRVLALERRGSYDGFPHALAELLDLTQRAGLAPSGPPMGVYYDDPAGVPAEELRYEAQLPVDGDVPPLEGLKVKTFPGGRMVSMFCEPHEGPREEDYLTLRQLVTASGRRVVGPLYEIYRAAGGDDGEHSTEICLRVVDAD